MEAQQKTHSTSSVSATCQNCKQEFIIEPDDFAFYEKVKVPPPTWCFQCRLLRKFLWRNERALYKRECPMTKKQMITIFSPDKDIIVYDRDYWWSDNWDQLASGKEYDFSRPFFEQWRELLSRAPLPNLFNSSTINSDYSNHNYDIKGCYLTFASFGVEDVHYSRGITSSKDSMDLLACGNAQMSYDDVLCDGISNVHFSYDADESIYSLFLRSCRNVNNSIGCVNLRNKNNL